MISDNATIDHLQHLVVNYINSQAKKKSLELKVVCYLKYRLYMI